MCSQTSNPVLLYKTWGTEQADEVDNIAKDDILFCIQTEFQKDLAKKFGVQIICVDSTHRTTMHDFLLITVMVWNEYDDGVPIAWGLSSRDEFFCKNCV